MLLTIFLTTCDTSGRRADQLATDSVRVVDDTGQPLALAAPARRVISLLPAVTDQILAMGAADRLIARSAFDTDPRLIHLPSTGNALTPNLEWVASLRPDLVITWPDQPSHPVISKLKSVGVPAYAAQTESIDDVRRTLRNLGALLGLESEARRVEAQLTAGFDSVRAAVAGKARVRVLYAISVDPPMIAGPGTFIGELIELSGGSNVFHDVSLLWPQVNLEEILRRQPEAIVVVQTDTLSAALTQLRTLPGWRELDAVVRGRVLTVDPNLFSRPGPNLPRAARRLAAFLHPESSR